MPTVTLDVVPLPPPRIKPHERTRPPFHSSLVFLTFAAHQNLLRTLTESQVKASLADTDLKLLLSAVKEGRVCHPSRAPPFLIAPTLMPICSVKARMRNFRTRSMNRLKVF